MFSEAITTTTTIFAVIVAVSNAIVALLSYLLAIHNTRHDKQLQKDEKIKNAEKIVDDACDKGNLSDLIDASKKLGDAKK